jgi:hypothetical protein
MLKFILDRRWARFSLRAFFVLLTFVCIGLAWQLAIVRERQALLNELKAKGPYSIMTAKQWVDIYGPINMITPTNPPARIPWARTWLGDEAIQEIGFHPWQQGFDKRDLERAAAVIPEAKHQEIHAIPCHPGCFPAGTLVETPTGKRPIEEIAVGDIVTIVDVTIVDRSRNLASARVDKIFITKNRLWNVTVEGTQITTTETQPLCLQSGENKAAGELTPGEQILCYRDGQVRPVEVIRVEQTNRSTTVYNLVIGDRQLFIAGGFVARSKPPASEARQNVTTTEAFEPRT